MNQTPGPQTAGGLARCAKFVVFTGFFAAGVVGFLLGSPKHRLHASQDEACRASCADIHKFHRLVPAPPSGSAPQGKYEGSWNCECY